MPVNPTPPRPLPTDGWGHAWARTALLALALLFAIFTGYEAAERIWLKDVYDTETLFRFHLYRGIGTSLLLAVSTMVGMWLIRRRYDRAFSDAYVALEAEAENRMRALVRSEAFTERLFDSLRDRVVVLDKSGRILKANRVALEAMGGKDCLGTPCRMLGGCMPGVPTCIAYRALDEGRAVVDEERTDTRTGRIFTHDAYPVPNPDGGEDLVIATSRDVTDAKQVEVRLRSQEKLAAIGVLSAGIAHDIANPLASMSSELELLESEDDLGRVRESLGVVRRHVSRISRTLRDMTDFARRRADEPHGTSSAQVAVDDALRMVRHDPRARRIRIDTQVAQGLPPLPVPEDQLVMVLVNLLINAFDAMPDGGRLTLKADRAGDGGVRLAVIDSGHGMSEEVRRRAVEPLFTTKPGGRGTGLGLSVSNELMRNVGGALELQSEPDAGTTVTLHFPRGETVAHV